MAKSLIRELTIKVNAKDLSSSSKEAEKLVNALVDAGTAAELVSKESKSINSSLNSITKAATSAAAAFEKFTLGNKVKSELNSVLEGINRIKTAAKDLKGLSVGVDLKVGNLVTIQDQVTRSLKGLDISINLKAGNINSTNDRLQSIVTSLQDAAAGIELLNGEFSKTASLLSVIKQDAIEASASLTKISLSKGLETDLEDIVSVLHDISEEIIQLNQDTQKSFGKMDDSINGVDDSLASINRTLHQTRAATKDSTKYTTQLVEKFDGLGNSLGLVETRVQNSTRGMRNQSRIMGDLAKLAGPLPTAYAMIAANVWAVSSAFEYLSSGDQLNRLERIGTVIGTNIGLPVQTLARQMVEATNGAISYEAALRKAANASGYGFSTEQLENMTKVARRAAVVMGVDMDDALNRIIKGISKQEIELLDELGITVRLTEAQSIYAKQIGTTTQALTSYQKQQAYYNAVIQQSEKAFGFLQDSDLGATNLEKLGARVTSLKDRFAQLLATIGNWTLKDVFPDSDIEKATSKLNGLEETLTSLQGAIRDGNLLSAGKLSASALSTPTENAGVSQREQLRKELEKEGVVFSDVTGEIVIMNNTIRNAGMISSQAAANMSQYSLAMVTHGKALSDIAVKTDLYNKILAQEQEIRSNILKQLGQLDTFAQGDTLIARFGELTDSIGILNREGTAGVNKLRESVKASQTPMEAYTDNLQQILNNYELIDKLKVDFPSIPDSVLNKMREYVDKVREAAGYSSRGALSNGINQGKSAIDFQKNVVDRAGITSAQTNLDNVGGITGTAAVANAKANIAMIQKQLEYGKIIKDNGDEETLSAKDRNTLEQQLLDAKLSLVSANQQLLQSEQSITALAVQRQNAMNIAGGMSAEQAALANSFNQLQLMKQQYAELEMVQTPKEQLLALDEQIQEKQLEVNKATLDYKLSLIDSKAILSELATASDSYSKYMSGIPVAFADAKKAADDLAIAEAKLAQLEADRATNSGVTDSMINQQKIAVERAKLAKVQSKEAAISAEHDAKALSISTDSYNMNLGELQVAKAQAQLEQETLNSLNTEHASRTAILEQENKLAQAQKNVNDILAQRQRDLVAGGIGAISGENQMQYTSTAGMGEEAAGLVRQGDSLANVANSFDQLAQYDQPFANVAANLSQMAIAIQDNASAMQIASIAGQAITSMFQMNGQAAVDAIDAEIAAEQKRDGKSAESLAKIKALEAKKIETTRKTARQTIIMQTAVGVANALAMGNPMVGIPMAIAVAAMGMQALKAADSAAESSLAGLDSSTSIESLTLGDRTNKVDTAQTANSGELSYIQGADGVGSIQNFTPRASGNNMYAGHAYLAGEKGPELILPDVNSVALSSKNTASAIGGGSGSNINLSIHALDAASFEDLVMSNPQVFRIAVESALNQEGKSLE